MPYRPINNFNVALILLIPTYTKVQGVQKKTFPALQDGLLFFGSFKSYGGTEHDVNGVYVVEDTATVETWYRPDIKSGCRIAIADSGEVYEVMGKPENIELRNQFLSFKVNRVQGGA